MSRGDWGFPLWRVLAGVGIGLLLHCPLGTGRAEAVVEHINFYWNTSNKQFSGATGAHQEIPLDNNLILVCPHEVEEYYAIYWVPEYVFEHCRKPENITLVTLLYCNNPYVKKPREFTIPIIDFSGVPGGKDFELGHNYYLTTLSTGSKIGMENTFQGACLHNNMKLNITIVPPRVVTQAPTAHPQTGTIRPATTPRPTRSTTRHHTITTSTTTAQSTTTKYTTHKPPNTDIPDPTAIVISVPDNVNSGIIDANSATSLTTPWVLVFAIVLSILHILNTVKVHR